MDTAVRIDETQYLDAKPQPKGRLTYSIYFIFSPEIGPFARLPKS
jgi:hypothetical protein